MKKPDLINHPKHYIDLAVRCHQCGTGIECIDLTQLMNFCLGNVVKYIWRAPYKGNLLQDLKKAQWYLNREIDRLSKTKK